MTVGKIGIIGGGVMGLTTAQVLLDAGYEVDVFTHQAVTETTSSKAAAIWLPYLAKPVEAVNRWSQQAFHVFQDLAKTPAAGISMVNLKVLVKDREVWWRDSIPEGGIEVLAPETLPPAFPLGYQLRVPLIETQIYLPYLSNRVTTGGGSIIFQEITDPGRLTAQYDYVVNCSGLGSRLLFNDETMYPVKGQLLKADKQPGVTPTIADFAFDAAGQELAYIIPRQDYLVLGGTALRGDFSEAPDPELTAAIIARCQRIAPGQLRSPQNVQLSAGLRPGRPSIRLEAAGKIIHNYGHGGAGFTVSWGCAAAVLALLKAR